MRNEFYIMRPDKYKKGLIELINYIKNNTDVDNISMVEIGAYMGESTIIFSDHFTSVTTIDPYLDNYDENDITCQYISLNEVYLKFLDNTKNNTNIKLIKNESFPNIAFNVDGSYFDVGTLSGYRDLINRLEL